MSTYAVASLFTPILNTPDFKDVFGHKDGCSLPLDEQGLLRPIEMIAFPGTRFEVVQECAQGILKVRTNEYSGEELYIDRRFVQLSDLNPPERTKVLPSADTLLNRLHSLLGKAYIWGGNRSFGISELLDYYPPKSQLDPSLESKWALKGVDCSGLLYEVTEGFTPRNTSQLVNYGTPLPIEGKNAEEISLMLRPLDLIVWAGHMVIVFDSKRSIESLGGKGVIIQNLQSRLEEIIHKLGRLPVNDWTATSALGKRFVIRRWIGNFHASPNTKNFG